MLDFPLLSQGATLSKLPLDDHLLDILQDLDGLRSMEEIVSFSPAEPGLLRRALALGIWLGVIEVNAEAGSQSQITGVGSDSLDGGPMLSAELLSDLTASEPSADLGGSLGPL